MTSLPIDKVISVRFVKVKTVRPEKVKTDTTVSGGSSFPVLSPPKPFQSMAEIDEDDDSSSDNSIMADNDSGDIILNRQPPDIDKNSLGTGTFYDEFTSIEHDTYDNRS